MFQVCAGSRLECFEFFAVFARVCLQDTRAQQSPLTAFSSTVLPSSNHQKHFFASPAPGPVQHTESEKTCTLAVSMLPVSALQGTDDCSTDHLSDRRLKFDFRRARRLSIKMF